MDIRRIALIPAYEPDFLLVYLVFELKKNLFEVVIVNDGSREQYEHVFKACSGKATVIRHTDNKGKGAALKTGLKHIRENYGSPYVVVTVDADGQHSITDVINVCTEAEKHPESIILGSRRFDKDVPLRSKVGNTITRFVYSLSSGVKVSDTQTGLRAFSQSVIKRLIDVDGDRYEYEMNVLMRCAAEGIRIREVWIETIYLENNRASHFNTVKDSFKIYKEILKFSMSSFISFILDYGLYCIIYLFSKQALFSNVAARFFSASFNYTFNKKMVFDSDASFGRSAVGYVVLAVAILVCNTLILKELLTLGINSYMAKVLTEILMFAVSYFVQHRFIFRKGVSDIEKA